MNLKFFIVVINDNAFKFLFAFIVIYSFFFIAVFMVIIKELKLNKYLFTGQLILQNENFSMNFRKDTNLVSSKN